MDLEIALRFVFVFTFLSFDYSCKEDAALETSSELTLVGKPNYRKRAGRGAQEIPAAK